MCGLYQTYLSWDGCESGQVALFFVEDTMSEVMAVLPLAGRLVLAAMGISLVIAMVYRVIKAGTSLVAMAITAFVIGVVVVGMLVYTGALAW